MICIVIPCFNESMRLDIASFSAHLNDNPETCLLFVDDASTDSTGEVLSTIRALNRDRVSILGLERNQGKAEAVRLGVLHGLDRPVSRIGFWDADLATPLDAIARFSERMDENPVLQLVSGSRLKRLGADIERRWYRHYAGRIIATFVSLLLRMPIYDSQCGAKLMTCELARQIFQDPFISRWLFDVELYARIIGRYGRQRAGRILQEIPLTRWTDIGDSKVSFSYLPHIPFELMRIRLHYRRELGRE